MTCGRAKKQKAKKIRGLATWGEGGLESQNQLRRFCLAMKVFKGEKGEVISMTWELSTPLVRKTVSGSLEEHLVVCDLGGQFYESHAGVMKSSSSSHYQSAEVKLPSVTDLMTFLPNVSVMEVSLPTHKTQLLSLVPNRTAETVV